MRGEPIDHPAWAERRLFLPLLGAVLGLAFHFLTAGGHGFGGTGDPLRLALASAVAVGGIAFAFTVERLRPLWAAAFGAAAGLVAGAIFYWNGSPGGYAGDEWQLVAILVAIAIAAPLLQAARDVGRWSRDYAAVHAYAWGNLVLWFAAWGFVLVTYLMALLLAELFNLIGIDILKEMVGKGWFGWPLVGAALGGAVALLRDRDRIMGLLQRVVMTVLSVLAPVLAAGLALFVVALPFTGLEPLWDRTSATTPTLLACVAGAVLLANAIIGNDEGEESRSPVLRTSALVLSLVVLPLATVALASTWLRIDQHGFTPQRLWGLVFVGITLVIALAYALSVLIGRRAWMASIRSSNLDLAMLICAVAVLLATPLSDFGGISARDQVARLRSGQVPPERFDWAALAFDFGPAGRRALERLAAEGRPQVRELAGRALRAEERWAFDEEMRGLAAAEALKDRLIVRPNEVEIPESLKSALGGGSPNQPDVCGGEGRCYLFWTPGSTSATAVHESCPPDRPDGACELRISLLESDGRRWWSPGTTVVYPGRDPELPAAEVREALRRGSLDVREVTRRQLYIEGRPVGDAF